VHLPDAKSLGFWCLFPVSLILSGMAVGADTAAAPETSNTPVPPSPALLAANANAIPLTKSNNKPMEVPVLPGEPVKGIKIPQYDENGNLTMCLTAETALKLNDHQVELSSLKVQFDEKEEKEIIVKIPHSILNLDTKILSADSETQIHREDFDIVGESAEFDTLARQGTFKGRVHASFINDNNIAQP
jgi:hypothetical protein